MISVPWQCGQCRTCMIMTSLDWVEGCSDFRTPEEHSRPTPLKHLQMLQRPKDKFDPGAPSPPANQPRRAHRCRPTKQVVAILAWFIDDDHRHLPISRAGRCQPGIADPGLPGALAPRPV